MGVPFMQDWLPSTFVDFAVDEVDVHSFIASTPPGHTLPFPEACVRISTPPITRLQIA